MEELSVLALGSVKEEGDDPARDGEKEHNTRRSIIVWHCLVVEIVFKSFT